MHQLRHHLDIPIIRTLFHHYHNTIILSFTIIDYHHNHHHLLLLSFIILQYDSYIFITIPAVSVLFSPNDFPSKTTQPKADPFRRSFGALGDADGAAALWSAELTLPALVSGEAPTRQAATEAKKALQLMLSRRIPMELDFLGIS